MVGINVFSTKVKWKSGELFWIRQEKLIQRLIEINVGHLKLPDRELFVNQSLRILGRLYPKLACSLSESPLHFPRNINR